MAVAQVVCRGVGPGATIALLVTAGYVSAPVVLRGRVIPMQRANQTGTHQVTCMRRRDGAAVMQRGNQAVTNMVIPMRRG